jgi:hypothetical protein
MFRDHTKQLINRPIFLLLVGTTENVQPLTRMCDLQGPLGHDQSNRNSATRTGSRGTASQRWAWRMRNEEVTATRLSVRLFHFQNHSSNTLYTIFRAGRLILLHFYPEHGGNLFPRNVG